MKTWIVFLRAVNVGGTGKLPMVELRQMCEALGFKNVKTYIASGNIVLTSKQSKRAVQQALEMRLEKYMGKPVGVRVLSAAELRDLVDQSPFADADPKKATAVLLAGPVPADAISQARHRQDEQMATGQRVIYVHYPSGMGRSRLSIPAAADGTARNMNTLRKMLEIADS
ncbi:MAG: DUF1697 domain-containing protein [Pseudomonadota bacterium]